MLTCCATLGALGRLCIVSGKVCLHGHVELCWRVILSADEKSSNCPVLKLQEESVGFDGVADHWKSGGLHSYTASLC
jgi:hypothetical protein